MTHFLRSIYMLLAFGLSILSTTANAEPLKVTTIPWVQSNQEIPHIAINNLPTSLQAIAENGNCSGVYAYRWDTNGDGDFNDSGEGWSNANSSVYQGFFAQLSSEVQLPSVLGDRLFYPKVQVTCGEETQTAVMPVLVKVSRICSNYGSDPLNANCGVDDSLEITRQTYSARALDRGLWYLFKQAVHKANDSLGNNQHLCYIPGTQTLYSTGQALNAFLRRGHGHGASRDSDPYYRHMTQCGVHSLLSTMQLRSLTFDDSAQLGFDGQGLQFSALNGLNAFFWSSYESTSWVEPLANFGNPEYLSPVGRLGVLNQSIRNISQDLADGLIQCMTADGAWFYTCSNLSGFTDDASTNGWAPEALRLLNRKLGVETYDSFKTNQRSWLATHCPNGYCTYDNGGPKLAGNALVGYGWTENEDATANPQVNQAVNAIQSWLLTDSNHWGLYYIYAVTKGLRSFVPEITHLPSGMNWSDEFTDFFLTGKNHIRLDNTAKQAQNGSWGWAGSWLWAGSLSTNERTALTVQVIQSWLEVFAYARAFPEAVSPGSQVSFDHSWSYTLDPAVSILEYKWNTVDYADPNRPFCQPSQISCQDLNGDGDCYDIDEQCNEDTNDDSKVTGDEIRWEFSTTNKAEQYKHIYNEPIGWGEVKKHKITLRTIDNLGRIVDDQSSVQIRVSKLNNPPVVVAHPQGNQGLYTAYPGRSVLLDGSLSYDLDAEQDPFPGSTSRPAGIADRISSIHFDLNLDGDFDDVGEDATLDSVSFVLSPDVAPDDLVAVPVRVCDDGQWTDSCIDGLDKPDCSLCSYGSATVKALANQFPPSIVTNSPYILQVDPENKTQILDEPFDLSQTVDPDTQTALGLKYQYEILTGSGELLEDGVYLSDPSDMGPNVGYYPFGDGPRIDLIKVIVTDVGGLSSEALIEVHVPNTSPQVLNAEISYRFTNVPLISDQALQSLGDGWYKLTISATVNPYVKAFVLATAQDKQDSIDVSFDINQDRVFDFTVSQNLSTGMFASPSFDISSGAFGNVVLIATDIDLDESVPYALIYRAPLVSPVLKYSIDVQNDLFLEMDRSPQRSLTFFTEPLENPLEIGIGVLDAYGNVSTRLYLADVSNDSPIFEQLRVLTSDSPTIFFFGSAIDFNDDQVEYEIDFGDGSLVQTSRSGFFGHTYDLANYELPKSFIANIRAIDSHGAQDEGSFEITFPAPVIPQAPVNRRPTIEQGVALVGYGGLVGFELLLRDLDGDALTTRIHFGDELLESQFTELFSTSFVHEYAYSETPYVASIQAYDGELYSDALVLDVEISDTPTEIRQIIHQITPNTRLLSLKVFATDSDTSTSNLKYFFDFENDGVFDISGSYDNQAYFEYLESGDKSIRVGVLDPWSNKITEALSSVNVPNLPVPENPLEQDSQILVLEDQSLPQPIEPIVVRDHVQGEEGRCIAFRVSEVGQNTQGTKLSGDACDMVGDDASSWFWDLGDESFSRGSEIGHIYGDDGLYSVIAYNETENDIRYEIQVHIANTNPSFLSTPNIFADAGAVYRYVIDLEDYGSSDEVSLRVLYDIEALGFDAVRLSKLDILGRKWEMEWEIPVSYPRGTVDFSIVAIDGHTISSGFEADGGRAEQRFRLYIQSQVFQDSELFDRDVLDSTILDRGVIDQASHLMSQDMYQSVPDVDKDSSLTKDKYVQEPGINQFSGGDRSAAGCQSQDEDVGVGIFKTGLFLLFIFVLLAIFQQN